MYPITSDVDGVICVEFDEYSLCNASVSLFLKISFTTAVRENCFEHTKEVGHDMKSVLNDFVKSDMSKSDDK